jgi:DNA-directed RNA polymerase sigma subunit (sigma70/sigma32)
MTRAADAIRRRFDAAEAKLRQRNEEIRRRRAAGESARRLAQEFNLSAERVRQIATDSAARTRKEAAAYRALVAEGKAPPLDGEIT